MVPVDAQLGPTNVLLSPSENSSNNTKSSKNEETEVEDADFEVVEDEK